MYDPTSESACGYDCGGWCDEEAERLQKLADDMKEQADDHQ